MSERFYFEVELIGSNNSITVGFRQEYYVKGMFSDAVTVHHEHDLSLSNSREYQSNWAMMTTFDWLGRDVDSLTYHGDTGKVWHQGVSHICGSALKANDVVGCGVDVDNKCIYFTHPIYFI